LTLATLGAVIFLAPSFAPPIRALAWGVVIGGIAQLLLQVKPLIDIGMFPRPALPVTAWRDEGVRRVLKAMAPAIVGVSAGQISVLINTQLAPLLGDGRVSWLPYPDPLMP